MSAEGRPSIRAILLAADLGVIRHRTAAHRGSFIFVSSALKARNPQVIGDPLPRRAEDTAPFSQKD